MLASICIVVAVYALEIASKALAAAWLKLKEMDTMPTVFPVYGGPLDGGWRAAEESCTVTGAFGDHYYRFWPMRSRWEYVGPAGRRSPCDERKPIEPRRPRMTDGRGDGELDE